MSKQSTRHVVNRHKIACGIPLDIISEAGDDSVTLLVQQHLTIIITLNRSESGVMILSWPGQPYYEKDDSYGTLVHNVWKW